MIQNKYSNFLELLYLFIKYLSKFLTILSSCELLPKNLPKTEKKNNDIF
ncbi:hypothetical protein NSTC745_01710 [Nostoc sp. DSM 114161]|jgi:hypothetical protein